jgi:hypothetical protein
VLKVVQFEIVQPERRPARRRVRASALSRGRTPFPGPRAFPRPTPRPGAPRFFPAPRVTPRRSRRTRACRAPGGPPVRPVPRPYARRPRLPPYHGSIFVVTPTSPGSRPYLRQHALPPRARHRRSRRSTAPPIWYRDPIASLQIFPGSQPRTRGISVRLRKVPGTSLRK